ncbi:calmodulin-like isoform X2 [Pomacea canaliculata]|uniref:calmodulin-like isoform X2 n=1 Tax=Pomacea canaliculata TaxID=400727 RepID=UPI000D72E034|nr:calmodulin-like isoform X2 [Pomacea canaliculata]
MATAKDSVAEAFELFDTDSRGQISAADAGTAIRALGHVITDNELRSLLNRAGIDPVRGHVDLTRFRQLVQPLQGRSYGKQVEDAFKTIDKEGSGFIMVTELRHLLTNMGDRIADEDFNLLLQELEVDSNGRVCGKDIVRLLSR